MILVEALLVLLALTACIYWIKFALLAGGWVRREDREQILTFRSALGLTAVTVFLIVLTVLFQLARARFDCPYQHVCASVTSNQELKTTSVIAIKSGSQG